MMAVLEEVGEELSQDEKFKELIMEPLNILGVEEFGDSEVTIRMFFTTQPLKQWDVAREFRRRVKKAFDEKGIRSPSPTGPSTWASPKSRAASSSSRSQRGREGGRRATCGP